MAALGRICSQLEEGVLPFDICVSAAELATLGISTADESDIAISPADQSSLQALAADLAALSTIPIEQLRISISAADEASLALAAYENDISAEAGSFVLTIAAADSADIQTTPNGMIEVAADDELDLDSDADEENDLTATPPAECDD